MLKGLVFISPRPMSIYLNTFRLAIRLFEILIFKQVGPQNTSIHKSPLKGLLTYKPPKGPIYIVHRTYIEVFRIYFYTWMYQGLPYIENLPRNFYK